MKEAFGEKEEGIEDYIGTAKDMLEQINTIRTGELPDVPAKIKDSIRMMRRAADRCLEGEKVAWTLQYLMHLKPSDYHTMHSLAEILHHHLAHTASVVKTIPAIVEAERQVNSGQSEGGSG